jgi:polyhydroxyalkanoate synthesis repressor PhaR
VKCSAHHQKYPNRRLYDTETSNYITLSEVKQLVLSQTEFRVVDAKSNEDLTRNILMQIILDEEGNHGAPMFTSEVLTQIIRFYGHAMQGVMGSFLEKSIHSFIDVQQKLQDQAKALYGEAPKVNTEIWSQFFKNQVPGAPNIMGNYLEQSANMFLDIQEQMQTSVVYFRHLSLQNAAGRAMLRRPPNSPRPSRNRPPSARLSLSTGAAQAAPNRSS